MPSILLVSPLVIIGKSLSVTEASTPWFHGELLCLRERPLIDDAPRTPFLSPDGEQRAVTRWKRGPRAVSPAE
jgi:hypothetical protein